MYSATEKKYLLLFTMVVILYICKKTY